MSALTMVELNDFAGLGQTARARREDRSRRYYRTVPRVAPPPVLDPRVIPGKTVPRTLYDPYAYRAPPPPPPPPAPAPSGPVFTNPVWIEPAIPDNPFSRGRLVFVQPAPKAPVTPPAGRPVVGGVSQPVRPVAPSPPPSGPIFTPPTTTSRAPAILLPGVASRPAVGVSSPAARGAAVAMTAGARATSLSGVGEFVEQHKALILIGIGLLAFMQIGSKK